MEDLERSVGQHASRVERWAAVSAVPQQRENADSPRVAEAKWSKIYALFEARGEAAQDEVFAAVNYYFLCNGASPSGRYTKDIRTAGGIAVSAGEVVKVTGKLPGEIRQFLRGRLEDSYTWLKHSSAVRNDEALAAAAQNANVNKADAWLLADWLGRDCQFFVGSESEVYNTLRSAKIANAYAKSDVARPAVDRVAEYAPESKVVRREQHVDAPLY